MSNKIKYRINSDISKARTLHSDYYTDDIIFINSIKNIFSSCCQLVAHKKEFKSNNIIPIKILPEESLILTMGNQNIHCVSNICTHRGHIVCDKKMTAQSMTCRYHGRSFHLNGQFKNAIGFEGVKNFPSKEDNLKKIDIKEWKDFIFVSLNGLSDISNILLDIDTRLKSFPFDKIKHSEKLSSVYKIDVHWALYCENYLEGFHVPFIHKGLSKEINNDTYSTILLDSGVLQFANSRKDKDNIYGYYYWIFPNFMLNFYNWGLSINIVEPISKNRTRVRFLSYPIENNRFTRNAINDLNTVELEDQQVIQSVQNGIKSRYYLNGRYSAANEKGIHYFHTLLSNFI